MAGPQGEIIAFYTRLTRKRDAQRHENHQGYQEQRETSLCEMAIEFEHIDLLSDRFNFY